MWRYFALLSLHAPNEQHEYMVSIWQRSPSHSNMERHRVLALQFGILSVRHGCSRFYFPSIVYLILSTPCWLNIKKYTSHISLRSRILLTCRSESLPPYVEEFPYCRISQGKSATGPDREFAWQALWKDATVPP